MLLFAHRLPRTFSRKSFIGQDKCRPAAGCVIEIINRQKLTHLMNFTIACQPGTSSCHGRYYGRDLFITGPQIDALASAELLAVAGKVVIFTGG